MDSMEDKPSGQDHVVPAGDIVRNSDSEDELKSPATAVVSEGTEQATQQDVEQPQPSPAAVPDLDKQMEPEEVTLDKVREYVDPDLNEVLVSALVWDKEQKWGQIRVLNQSLVEYYIKIIKKEPPRLPVRVLLRNMGDGVLKDVTTKRRKYFHISQAVHMPSLADNISVQPSKQCTWNTLKKRVIHRNKYHTLSAVSTLKC